MDENKMLDKTSWGPGPWQHEPNRVDWADEATGLLCSARRHPQLGHWCGYVAVPPNHPLFGQEVPNRHVVHAVARINFADSFIENQDEEFTGRWWLGFDCAHMDDLVPAMEALERSMDRGSLRPTWKTYRTIEDVRTQCTQLTRVIALDIPTDQGEAET